MMKCVIAVPMSNNVKDNPCGYSGITFSNMMVTLLCKQTLIEQNHDQQGHVHSIQ